MAPLRLKQHGKPPEPYYTPVGLAVGVHTHSRPCQRGRGWVHHAGEALAPASDAGVWTGVVANEPQKTGPAHDGSGVLMACIKDWRRWREIKAWSWPSALSLASRVFPPPSPKVGGRTSNAIERAGRGTIGNAWSAVRLIAWLQQASWHAIQSHGGPASADLPDCGPRRGS